MCRRVIVYKKTDKGENNMDLSSLDFGQIFAILDWVTKVFQKYTEMLFGFVWNTPDENANAHLDNPAQDGAEG